MVVPNLWGAIVASPGLLKSPAIQAITARRERSMRDFAKTMTLRCGNTRPCKS